MESVKDLLAQRADIEKKIHDAQRAERQTAITHVRELMSARGLTMGDLSPRKAPGPKGPGTKVAIKYRNATTGDAWSGRGLQPKWLRAELQAGKKLADFSV